MEMCKNRMCWSRLICDKRLGLEHYTDSNNGGIRSDFQRDYDRLIFSSPFRRLQNKTQVFPLPGSIFVHNRLTHSLEVSSVGKSLAREVSIRLHEKYKTETWVDKLDEMAEIVSAACLAHDLGNPPFGHSGEKAISSFFSEGEGTGLKSLFTIDEWNDLIHFEGNANSFRQLVHQFAGRRPGGFAMTYSMLASIVKYPYSSSHVNEKGKFTIFVLSSLVSVFLYSVQKLFETLHPIGINIFECRFLITVHLQVFKAAMPVTPVAVTIWILVPFLAHLSVVL